MMDTSDEIAAIVYHVQLLYLSDSHSLAIALVYNYSIGSALEWQCTGTTHIRNLHPTFHPWRSNFCTIIIYSTDSALHY